MESALSKAQGWSQNLYGRAEGRGRGLVPRLFAPPYGGSAYFGQAYKWETVLHYKYWAFVAIKCHIREVAGGAPPNLGFIRPRKKGEKAYIRKSLGGPREHEQFEAMDADHPVAARLRRPNFLDVRFDLWAYHTLFIKLTGEVTWWVICNAFGMPTEIWPIPTHWRRLDTYTDGMPRCWIVQSPWGTLQEIPYDQTVTFLDHSPLNRYEGNSVGQNVAEWIDVYESMTRARLAAFKNGAVPSIHVALGDAFADPDEAFLSRFYAKWFARFQGEDNFGKPLITPADVEVKQISGQMSEVGFEKSEDQIRDMTLAAYGVPKGVPGLEPSADISSYAPQRQFCRFTINPDLCYYGEVLTEKYVRPTRGCEDGCAFWDDRVIDDPDQKLKEIESRRAGGSLTVDEERALWGAEPYPFGGRNPMVNGVEMPWVEPIKQHEQLESAFKRALSGSNGSSGGYLATRNGAHR